MFLVFSSYAHVCSSRSAFADADSYAHLLADNVQPEVRGPLEREALACDSHVAAQILAQARSALGGHGKRRRK
jgi:hypothetical protein